MGVDDGIVVGKMSQDEPNAMTVEQYFRLPEVVRPMELVYGVVREPPAPRYGHQSVVTRLTVLLDTHVREHGLGEVCVSPVDVVLDRAAALVVQPDVIFVSRARAAIIRDRVWGAPDLTIEVLSARTESRDRMVTVGWYRRYGVRECWLVDTHAKSVEVIIFGDLHETSHVFAGDDAMRSSVLPQWHATPALIVAP